MLLDIYEPKDMINLETTLTLWRTTMETEFFQLPELKDIKDLIKEAKHDIEEEISSKPEMADEGKLIKEVMAIIEVKLAKHKDLNKLSLPEKIDIAAHVSFFHSMLEEFFFDESDLDFDDEDFDDEESEEDEE